MLNEKPQRRNFERRCTPGGHCSPFCCFSWLARLGFVKQGGFQQAGVVTYFPKTLTYSVYDVLSGGVEVLKRRLYFCNPWCGLCLGRCHCLRINSDAESPEGLISEKIRKQDGRPDRRITFVTTRQHQTCEQTFISRAGFKNI
jgi:hypothetical protein